MEWALNGHWRLIVVQPNPCWLNLWFKQNL